MLSPNAPDDEEVGMPEKPRVCIDRVLPRDTDRWMPTVEHAGSMRAIIVFSKMWINGSTLRVRFMEGTPQQQAIAREQAMWWTEHANLSLAFTDDLDAEIRIAFAPYDGAWSFIGTDCAGIPQGEPTMNLGFLDGGTAAHEFGHAIGLAHEHQNPAGGIQWNEDVVIRDLSGPPNSWTPDQIRHNVLDKYSVAQIRGTEFDPDSIMLYFFPGTWTTTGVGTHANDVLSALDKGFVAGAQAYPKTAVGVEGAVELKVGAASSTRASIGRPGEEDLFAFTAAQAGRYKIETLGKTDVVMKLFGPTSQTNLIAEDDDSGISANARIIANLIPGTYYAQIRHFYKASGTGDYRIRVRTA
jgi:Astacin (Peptidase family M12A)